MTNRRAKVAAGATVVGLAALGGVALGSNPGTPGAVQQGEAGATASVVTGASGAAATAEAATATAKNGTEARAPIVTRSSGAGTTVHDD